MLWLKPRVKRKPKQTTTIAAAAVSHVLRRPMKSKCMFCIMFFEMLVQKVMLSSLSRFKKYS